LVRGKQDDWRGFSAISLSIGNIIQGLVGFRPRSLYVLDEPAARLDQSSCSTSISSSGVHIMGVLIP
jgi:hypothetical protein